MQKPEVGKKYGCSDQGPPQNTTQWALSRVADMLYAAFQLGGHELMQKVFMTLDDSVKLEFNYARWTYVA